MGHRQEKRSSLLDELEHLEAEVVHGLVRRLRLDVVLRRLPARVVWSLFVFLNGFLTITILAALAAVSHTPFIFPSLGPSAFLFFFHPRAPSSMPRNAVIGHAIGIGCGVFALWVTGLLGAPSAMVEGVHGLRVFAIGLSLAMTGALMAAFAVPHPPAGATTLIISLGILTAPFQLFVLEIAVVLLVLQAIVINRLAGLKYPLWNPVENRMPR